MKPLTKSEKELIKKYTRKLDQNFNTKSLAIEQPIVSESYHEFKKENLPKHLSLYEKLCNSSSRILKIQPGKKSEQKLRKQMELCHLETTPAGVFSLAILVFLATFIIVGTLGFLVFQSILFYIYSLMTGLVVLAALLKMPEFLANGWRLKASNQMVQCIFYLVTYLRHTSNLELAVRFAAEHLIPPLSLDLKKVLWDLETEKYETVQESLDNYLEKWKDYNPEFVEAFHLIEGSLFEPSEDKRLSMVDKALSVMLQETYEKMLRYTHELKSPVTMLYMLGIILPILGLVILPLVASFMTTDIAPLKIAGYIALIYNISLPLTIYYMGRMVLSKRPTGYGQTDISDEQPQLKKLKQVLLHFGKKEIAINPLWFSISIGGVLLFIGLLPLLAGFIIPDAALLNEPYIHTAMQLKFLEFRQATGSTGLIGPYGIGASILSLLVPLSLGIGGGLYFKLRSRNVMKIRADTKTLEGEFASALFQLGNRLGDGIPVEVAFSKVAQVTKGTKTGDFFSQVDSNIRNRGVSADDALFNKRYGAVGMFPSSVIASSMKVLMESSKKGPKIASQAMINVSEYIKEIHRVDERLRDLMAELISDMKQQVKVLAPAIAGIVVGITSMIVGILGRLTDQLAVISSGSGTAANVPSGLITLFGDGVPTYFFQIIVGLYIVQIVYILTVMVNGIENGADKLAERSNLGDNLIKSTLIYVIIAFTVIMLFNFMAGSIMQGLLTT